MKPQAYKRARMLVIAIALIAADTSVLRGQRDSDDMVFETPLINDKHQSATNPSVNVSSPRPPTTPTMSPLSPAGRASLSKRSSIKSNNNDIRKSIPGTEPKRVAANPAPAATPTEKVAQAVAESYQKTGGRPAITPVAHHDSNQGITRDGLDPLLMEQRERRNSPIVVTSPVNRGSPPPVRGSYLGLNGETATERAIQIQTLKMELEQENEILRQQNAGLQTRVKETQDQLMAAAREIQSARKEVTAARGDLDRLRADLQSLREKVRMAEKEHTGFLQSMGPLLQQLLESNDVTALPPNPTE